MARVSTYLESLFSLGVNWFVSEIHLIQSISFTAVSRIGIRDNSGEGISKNTSM